MFIGLRDVGELMSSMDGRTRDTGVALAGHRKR
jgi:hypothetical protein